MTSHESVPSDVVEAARAHIAQGEMAIVTVVNAIMAERERCAQSLEALVERRREEKSKAHLGNSYILSCASFIRRGRSPSQTGAQ